MSAVQGPILSIRDTNHAQSALALSISSFLVSLPIDPSRAVDVRRAQTLAAMTAADSGSLSRQETITLLILSGASVAIILNTFQGDGEPLIASLALSIAAFALCYAMIRWLGPAFMAAGFKGRDMSKTHHPVIPESLGAVCAAVYLLVIIVFIPFPFYKDIVAATSGGGNRDVVLEVEHINQGRYLHRFPHSKVIQLFSAKLVLDCRC